MQAICWILGQRWNNSSSFGWGCWCFYGSISGLAFNKFPIEIGISQELKSPCKGNFVGLSLQGWGEHFCHLPHFSFLFLFGMKEVKFCFFRSLAPCLRNSYFDICFTSHSQSIFTFLPHLIIIFLFFLFPLVSFAALPSLNMIFFNQSEHSRVSNCKFDWRSMYRSS